MGFPNAEKKSFKKTKTHCKLSCFKTQTKNGFGRGKFFCKICLSGTETHICEHKLDLSRNQINLGEKISLGLEWHDIGKNVLISFWRDCL